MLEDYFGYNCLLVMNITDVDDKIICRACQEDDGACSTMHALRARVRAYAAKYESDFLQDMDTLGCRRPSVLTRVSEYMPEIVQYIQHIMDNKLAYDVNGSVYFDSRAFDAAGFQYGKFGRGVGVCHRADDSAEKRCPQDFALWKRAKPNEPAWESPWGPGRPGWHIECSAMAHAILGPIVQQ